MCQWCCCSSLTVAHMPLVDRCISYVNSCNFFMIFSTCVILICLCRRNLQLLKCWSLLHTWSCTTVTPVLYGGSREMMWWRVCICPHPEFRALCMSNRWLWSLWEPSVFLCPPPGQYSFLTGLTRTYQNILRVGELVDPHRLSFIWLSIRVLHHVQQHILEGSEGVCS